MIIALSHSFVINKMVKYNADAKRLFGLSDKGVVNFACQVQNMNLSDITNPEMMRRLNISIKEFNKNSSKQTKTIILLTRAMILIGIAQIGLLIYSFFT